MKTRKEEDKSRKINSKAGFLQPVNSEGFSAIHSMLLLEWYTHPLRWSEITKKPSPLTHSQSHYRLHFLKLKKSKWRTKPPVSPYNLEGKRGIRAERESTNHLHYTGANRMYSWTEPTMEKNSITTMKANLKNF